MIPIEKFSLGIFGQRHSKIGDTTACSFFGAIFTSLPSSFFPFLFLQAQQATRVVAHMRFEKMVHAAFSAIGPSKGPIGQLLATFLFATFMNGRIGQDICAGSVVMALQDTL